MDRRSTSISPMPASDTGVDGNETPSWFDLAPASRAKQRTSLMSRLKTGGPVSRPYERPSSVSSVVMSERSSRRASCDWRSGLPLSPYERPESATKSLLSRGGRMLKRHGSKFSLSTFLLEEESDNGSMEVSETCQRPQQSQKEAKSSGSKSIQSRRFQQYTNRIEEDLKRSISHPFDFHHVTHTKPRHFERLDQGSQNELINEFIAIRAAQRPKSTLQGINADDLRNTSHVTQSASVQRQPSTTGTLRSPLGHLNFPGSPQTSPTSPGCVRGISSSTSIENFSRPAPWSPKSPRSPPPRTSSRHAVDCSHASVEAMSKSAGSVNRRHNGELLGEADSAIDSEEAHITVTHAITTVDDSAKPLKIWPLPTQSRDVVSGSSANTGTQAEQGSGPDVSSSMSLPLRHAHSFPTTRMLAQQDHHQLSKNGRHARKRRPEPLEPAREGRWEDVVDYSYEQAAEADCNFDWSQKTVYVDGDLESTHAPAFEGRSIEVLASATDEQPDSSDHRGPRPCPGAFPPRRASTRNDIHSRPTSKKSVMELEGCLSPFGRHQSSSDLRGYQHVAQSKSPSNIYAASKDVCVDDDAYLQKEASDCAELEQPMEQSNILQRCDSGESSSFCGLRPLTNKYSSDGSLLSSTTSTIRTYRSSNSVGSLPELVSSLDCSRENDRMSPADAVYSGLYPNPPRLTPASRSHSESDNSTAELEVPSLPQVISSTDAASDISSTVPISSIKLQERPREPVGKRERADSDKAKPRIISTRKRSASAVTPAQRPPTRGSYSLFPTQQTLNRGT